VSLVSLESLLKVREIWKNFDNWGEGWLDDEVNEADLTLCYVSRGAVEKLADWERVTFL
jgi:hypothetical protein